MKKDVIKNVLVISLSILVVGLSGYIVYDKLFSNNDVNNTNNGNSVYSYNDFSETVFSDDSGNNYLILWKNGTYSYNNTIGNYIVDNNNIILNYIFDNGNVVNEESQIKLVINSLAELEDTIANVKLNKVNHPTSPGGNDFYYNVNLYKYESNGLSKLISGYWWKEDTDKFLHFYQSHFSIGRDGKGCGPEHGCGAGMIDSIVKRENNIYDINFAYYGNDGSNIYLATIDISNIENDKITLLGFYEIQDNNKISLIDNQEEYYFAGYTDFEARQSAYGN